MDLESTIFKDEPVVLTIMECSICYVNKVELSFLCKHSVCKSCYRNIEICPFCRKRIKPRKQKTPIHRTNVIVEYTNEGEVRGRNFYFVLCVMMMVPLIWLCFVTGVLINSNI